MILPLLLLFTLGSPPTFAQEGEVAAARLVQATLPELEGRASAARAKIAARKAFFAGKAELAVAFPDLELAPLNDSAFLAGRLQALQQAAQARAAERVASAPAALAAREASRLSTALAATLDSEEQADLLEGRLLTGIEAGLAQAPELQAEALIPEVDRLRSLVRTATGLDPTAPDPDGHGATAAQAGADLARLAALERAVWRRFTVPGDRRLEALADQDLDAAGAPDPARSDRLQRVLPLLDPARAQRATEILARAHIATMEARIAALSAALEARRSAPPQPGTVEDAKAAVEAAQEQLKTLQESPQTTDPALVPTAERLRAVELELANLALTQAQAAEVAAEAAARAAPSVTSADIEEAGRSAAEAAEAARIASEQQAGASARLLGDIADFKQRTTDVLTQEKARGENVDVHLKEGAEQLRTLRQEAAAALLLGPLDPTRIGKVDQAYLGLHALVGKLDASLSDIQAAGAEILRANHEIRASIAATEEAARLLEAADPEVAAQRRAAIVDLNVALDARIARVRENQDAVVDLLRQARASRRAMRPEATAGARTEVGRDIVPELGREITTLPARASAGLRAARTLLEGVPSILTDLPALTALFVGSFEMLALIAAWLLLRPRTDKIAATLIARLRGSDATTASWLLSRVHGMIGLEELDRVTPLLSKVLRQLLDLVGSVLLYLLIPSQLEALALIPLALGWRAAVRLAPALVTLTLVEPGERRPGLVDGGPGMRARLSGSLRLLLIWRAAISLTSFITLVLLDADRMEMLTRTLGTIAGFAIALWLLHRWASTVRTRLADTEQTALTRWLVKPNASVVVGVVQAAVGVVVLAIRGIADLGRRLVQQRAGLQWLGAALARQQLKDTDANVGIPLPDAQRHALGTICARPPVSDKAVAELRAAVDAWLAQPARGLVAVTGDRGSGVRALISKLPEIVGDRLGIRTVEVPEDTRSLASAIAWLKAELAPEAEAGQDLHRLVSALEGEPAMVLVIVGIDRLLLRAVSGFQALREVLTVLHGISDEHLVIGTLHGPTWSFLEGVPGAVNLEVFNTHVHVPPVGPATLASWLEGALMEGGMRLSYAALVSQRQAGGDLARAQERARDAYWRLLADAAQGSPTVARDWFLASLRPTDDPEVVEVGIFHSPDTERMDALGDRELFVLTGLVLHDGLSVGHLAESLNIPAATVRSVCRQLEAWGTLERRRGIDGYRVEIGWLPAVERLLRQKQLIHLR